MTKFVAAALIVASAGACAHAGEAVTKGNRPAYCRGEVAEQFGAKPADVKTGELATADDGTTSISGSVDLGSHGTKDFQCRFDADGKFIDVLDTTAGDE